jgi:asparagine synthase (glutamine-hydrolysing)
MCGICGVASIDAALPIGRCLEPMLETIAHRGPDGFGTYREPVVQLGHRRLSILDPTEAGDQPMERHGVVLIHNGEIYNYLELAEELRSRGYSFSTETDTEVMLAAYDAWGLDAFARFNGMWAFAMWDKGRRRLILSRDRLGVKPMYYRATPHTLAFASEVKALVRAGPLDEADGWKPEPDLTTIADFLGRGLVDHSDHTFVSGIRSLNAGHSLVLQDGTQKLIRYWGPPALADDVRPRVTGEDARRDADLVEAFRSLFDESVRLRLRADVPIGTCLSGGLDSSSIVTTAAKILDAPRPTGAADATQHEQQPRFAFHARFPELGVDESAFAEIVARQSGLELVFRSPGLASVFGAMQPVLEAQGEPFYGTSVIAQYAVMEAARSRGLKVLLDGQGGDELLAGYLPYLGYRTAGLLRSIRPFAAVRELRDQTSWGSLRAEGALLSTVRALAPADLVEAIRRGYSGGRHGIRVTDELSRHGTAAREHKERGTVLARRLWQDIASESLPSMLRYEDRNSMAFGIEARVPFLDYRLVELTMRLPDRLKVHRGMTKWVLRRAMSGRVPPEVLARRDKVGFATPQYAWLRHARPEIERRMLSGQIVRRGWVSIREVARLLDQLSPKGKIHDQLWRAVVLESWLDQLDPAVPSAA